MNVFQVFQSLLPSQTRQDQLLLRSGQIVNATLIDMFPNGDAKVSIQGFMVRAKLETPMAKGEHTFMQVQSIQNGVVTMKILANNDMQATQLPTNNINQLLKNADLPQNTAWREVVQQMIQRNIPLLPDILQNGMHVLGKQPTEAQQQTWMTMLERGVPINQATFQAVHQVLYGQSVSSLVDALKGMIQQHLAVTGAANANHAQAANLNENTGHILTGQNALSINPQAASINNQAGTTVGPRANMGMGNSPSDPATRSIPTSILNNQAEAAKLMEGSNPSFGLGGRQSAEQSAMISPMRATLTSQHAEQARSLVSLQQALEQVSLKGEGTAVPLQTQSGANESPLAQIIKMFGYQHEKNAVQTLQELAQASVRGGDVSQQATGDSIKQMLLQITNQNQYPTAIREMASQLLNNITGQQLLSLPQDSQNMYQNTMLQIPVSWGENQQDTLTLQIQGRKDKKTIDPENCSVYLELTPPELGELGVFVQIVNRVVSVKLFTENEHLKGLVDSTYALLKQGLTEQGYMLSFVKVEVPEKEQPIHKALAAYNKRSTKGIDVRI